MNASDLNGPEKTALIALLAHLIDADGEVAHAEAVELLHLQDELETKGLIEGVGKAREIFASRLDLIAYAARSVKREEARELIRTILHDLAVSDGNRVRSEAELMDQVTMAWATA